MAASRQLCCIVTLRLQYHACYAARTAPMTAAPVRSPAFLKGNKSRARTARGGVHRAGGARHTESITLQINLCCRSGASPTLAAFN